MRRREFVALLGGAAITWPLTGQAQPSGKVYRIAILHPSAPVADISETGDHPYFPVFFQELRRLGYVEERNLTVDRYSGEGRIERHAELARTAVGSKPDVILAISPHMMLPLKEATATIPIVGITGDPVASGLVTNLARPGGNITGISVDPGLEIYGKSLEIFKEAVPTISRVAFLMPRPVWEGALPGSRTANLAPGSRAVRQAADQLGMTVLDAALDSPIQESEYRRVFAAISQEGADALVVGQPPENLTHRRLIVELAEKARLPALYPWRDYVVIGGLMAYAVDLKDVFRRAADQVDEILKGATPSEMPIYQPTTFELIINAKTARALGLTLPPVLLARADEVIE